MFENEHVDNKIINWKAESTNMEEYLFICFRETIGQKLLRVIYSTLQQCCTPLNNIHTLNFVPFSPNT